MTNRTKKRRHLEFEALEARQLLTAVLSGGVLSIYGTSASDQIHVSFPPTQNPQVSVTTNGVNDGLFSTSSVSSIRVYAYGGDDYVRLNGAIPSLVYGSSGNDILYGGAAADQLIGGLGQDRIYGGAGDDHIDGGAGNDRLEGGVGNDTLWGREDHDWIYGEDGNDRIFAGNGTNWVWGGAGNDRLEGGANFDAFHGGDGDDELYGFGGNDVMSGDAGNDKLFGGNGNNRLDGRDGNDELYGGAHRDRLEGGSGNDRIFGFEGDDVIRGGDGHDLLNGGNGNNRIEGGYGNDELLGGAHRDQLEGGSGNDRIYGFDGDDVIEGGGGDDLLNGGNGNNRIEGGDGNDRLFGGAQVDLMYGGDGADLLYGYSGNDDIFGGDGNDSLYGHDGNDRLNGGAGNDTMYGGNGNDVFDFEQATRFESDTIHEPFAGGIDSLDFRGAGNVNAQFGGSSIIATGGNRTVRAIGSATNFENAFGIVGADIHVLDGGGQTVAVIDSGVDYLHPNLGGGFGAGFRVRDGFDFISGDGDPRPNFTGDMHGTHVAGIVGNDNAQFAGVATDVDLVALKVLEVQEVNGQIVTAGPLGLIGDALQWVLDHRVQHGITTVNVSAGLAGNWANGQLPADANGQVPAVVRRIDFLLGRLEAAGVFVAAAAGNGYADYNADGLGFPASSSHAVSVASHDNGANSALSGFSQRDSSSLVAPGESIVSTGLFGSFRTSSGTSQASPYVAGASVLIREAYEVIGETATVDQDVIYNVLQETAEGIGTGGAYSKVDLDAALAAVLVDRYFESDSLSDATGGGTATVGGGGVLGASLGDGSEIGTMRLATADRVSDSVASKMSDELPAQVVATADGMSDSVSTQPLTFEVVAANQDSRSIRAAEGKVANSPEPKWVLVFGVFAGAPLA